MDQLTKLLAGLSTKQRISIVLGALLAGAGIFAVMKWRHASDFRPLYTSMAAEDAANVVQKLKETGVEYRLSESGSAVLVQSSRLAESRLALAAAGLPKTGRIGFELFDKTNFGATEFVEHINYKRALEGELERSVMSLAEVEQARVHLTLPKQSVFLDQQQPAKASVMVKLRPGANLSAQNVLAVTNLVAGAVEGLSPDGVSLVDMEGNLLRRPRKTPAEGASEATEGALELRQKLEHDLVWKISTTLEPLLGANGFRAGASVDCDLTSGEQQEESFDPARSVMMSSQKTEDTNQRLASSGIPGTASNLPAPASRPSTGSGGGSSRRTENITYQTSRVVRHTRIPEGGIKRMSLAVLVDQSVRWEGKGAERHRVLVPPPPETMKSIKDLVSAVTGFNAERGDQLIVETLPFETSLNSAPPEAGPATPPATAPALPQGPPWLQILMRYRELLAPAAVGLAMLFVLIRVIWKLASRRKRPAVVEVGPELDAAPDMPQLQPATAAVPGAAIEAAPQPQQLVSDANRNTLERVRELMQRDASVTANVLRAWLQDSGT